MRALASFVWRHLGESLDEIHLLVEVAARAHKDKEEAVVGGTSDDART